LAIEPDYQVAKLLLSKLRPMDDLDVLLSTPLPDATLKWRASILPLIAAFITVVVLIVVGSIVFLTIQDGQYNADATGTAAVWATDFQNTQMPIFFGSATSQIATQVAEPSATAAPISLPTSTPRS
jgi:hypothetical protein